MWRNRIRRREARRMAVAPLAGLTVVESAGSIAGAYCARLFALQGADVRLIGHDELDLSLIHI